jgi:uncharacterized protein (TIRG00374 family)
MDIKIRNRFLFAIIVSVGLMIFLLTRVEMNQFYLIAGRLNKKWLIASCVTFMGGNLIRVFRFYHLDYTDNKLIRWWCINAFYNFITATLPGGAGEASTTYVLKRFAGFDLLRAVRMLILSRLMDLFALSSLFFISAILITNVTPYRETAVFMSGILFLVSSAALSPSAERLLMNILQKLATKYEIMQKISKKISALTDNIEEKRSNKMLGIALFQSAAMMIAGTVSVHLLLMSFGIDFTLIQSTYCYGIYMIFQIVPIHGIAGIGTQAAWWALALKSAGYYSSDAIALGIIMHGILYGFITLIGASALLLPIGYKINKNNKFV